MMNDECGMMNDAQWVGEPMGCGTAVFGLIGENS
jgi:hypothetical protein